MTFLEVLSLRGVRFRRNSSQPSEIYLNCPFCSDTRFRLGLNFRKGLGHCFNCGWRSRKAVKSLLRQLAIADEVQEAEIGSEGPTERPLQLPQDFTLLASVKRADGPLWAGRRYLLDRRVTAKQIREKYLGACLTGRFGYRIIIPVVVDDDLKGIVARDWTGRQEPKYLNSSGERSVYNLAEANGGPLFVSEGCFKALAIEAAIPGVNSVALLGHSVSPLQLDQIADKSHTKVVLWPDPDRAGVLGALRVASALAERGLATRLVYPLPVLQADETAPAEIVHRARAARPLTSALLQRVRLEAVAL